MKMQDINSLKEDYLNFLNMREESLKRSIEDLQRQECRDEANLEKIRLNVVEIFHKMFNISFSNDPVELNDKYLNFFDKITTPWRVNREKAIEFGKDREAIIEELKIEEAEKLKIKFKDYYEKIFFN